VKRLGWLLLLAVLAGCPGPGFDALNTPPPGKTAVVDQDEQTIKISRGVALAIGCSAACEGFEASTENSTLLGVKRAYLDQLVYFGAKGRQPRPAAVIYGLTAGRTKLFLSNDSGESSYEVEIIE
jgi:hypothetical protein